MRQVFIISSLILYSVVVSSAQQSPLPPNLKYAIEEPSNTWILELVDSLQNETSLCDSTCMSPPTFKRYRNRDGRILYRLRYACSDLSSFIQIYDSRGTKEAKCHIEDDIYDCSDFEAYTDFTFTKELLNIWSCKNGFNCTAKDSLGLFREYSIMVDGSECKDAIRELTVSSPFNDYSWQGANGKTSQKSSMTADASGMYELAVADQDGCQNSKYKEIHVYQEREIPVDGDKILCEDEVSYLTTEGFSSYEWSTGDTSDHIVVESGGIVSLKVTDELGCQDSTSIEIKKIENRSVNVVAGENLFYRDQVIPITLEMNGLGYQDIKDITWASGGELSCDDCPNPFGKFKEDSEIFVVVTDNYDCIYESDVEVHPENAFKDVYTSNVFTPNGDGENDIFYLRGKEGAVIVHTFKVFNRWGDPIHDVGRHSINDESKGWDGTANGQLLPLGVYVYMAQVEFIDGTKKYLTGDILLAH